MRKIVLCAIFLIVTVVLCYAQANSNNSKKTQSVQKGNILTNFQSAQDSRMSTLEKRIDNIEKDLKVDKRYMEVLEKTNQQLSMWTNPYGVAVGILSLFIAIIAIITAFIIYRQSKDYKESLKKRDEEFVKQQNVLMKTCEEAFKLAELQRNEEYKKRIEELNREIKNLEAEKIKLSAKEAEEKDLEELAHIKAKIENISKQISEENEKIKIQTMPTYNFLGHEQKQIKCKGCGKYFTVTRGAFSYLSKYHSLFSHDNFDECPKCGYRNYY